MDAQGELSLRQVLRGLSYPAERWQIITQAELFGADVATRSRLHDLPKRRYRSSTDVTSALDGDTGKST
jgi:hypothetical protein